MKTIYYAGVPCDGVGWGTCNANLAAAMARQHPTRLVDPEYEASELPLVFTPIADHDLRPAFKGKAKTLIGYGFFEFALGGNARENCRKYDLIFTGSSWCSEWMRSQLPLDGPPVATLVQGVDTTLFHPAPQPHEGFTIFSGGKFEWRKGQDLVIAAVAKVQAKHPIHLVTAWWNPWAQAVLSMRRSNVIKWALDDGELELNHLLAANGCDPSCCVVLDRTPHAAMPGVMNMCDLAVLPSRSEGGTNLVLMESMACGLPTVATYLTGHKDILTPDENCIPVYSDSVDELANQIEWAFLNQDKLGRIGANARKSIEAWTWDRTASTAIATLTQHNLL